MSFIDKIFERATVRGIANYLLFDETPSVGSVDYKTRINNSYKNCERVLLQYTKDTDTALFRAVDTLTVETEQVYMEIGMQAGFLIMKDMMKQVGNFDIQNEELNDMPYQEMYNLLFADISIALKVLQNKEIESIDRAIEILRVAQSKTEAIFIHSEK